MPKIENKEIEIVGVKLAFSFNNLQFVEIPNTFDFLLEKQSMDKNDIKEVNLLVKQHIKLKKARNKK